LPSPGILEFFLNTDVGVPELKFKPKKCHKIEPYSSFSLSLLSMLQQLQILKR
jgi:hypothetical protein